MGTAVVLVVMKFAAWLVTGAVALLTSAVDALVDVGASAVTFAGVRYAERPADLGHDKGEATAAFAGPIARRRRSGARGAVYPAADFSC